MIACAVVSILLLASSQTPGQGRSLPDTPARPPSPSIEDQADYERYKRELETILSKNHDPSSPQDRAPSSACPLFGPKAAQIPTADCMSCHALSRTHPVDIDYAAAAQRRSFEFRPVQEVIRRGVFLPQGQVRCVTCHDGASPWKYSIALPPASQARPAVVISRNPQVWEKAASAEPLRRGAAVTPTPLCLACHAMD